MSATATHDATTLIMRFRNRGAGFSAIASVLNRDGIPTPRGRRWHAATVRAVVLRHSDAEAAVAASRHVTADGVVYACGVCGFKQPAADMLLSTHTGSRYCSDLNACRERIGAS
jgi:hypothetical protein